MAFTIVARQTAICIFGQISCHAYIDYGHLNYDMTKFGKVLNELKSNYRVDSRLEILVVPIIVTFREAVKVEKKI